MAMRWNFRVTFRQAGRLKFVLAKSALSNSGKVPNQINSVPSQIDSLLRENFSLLAHETVVSCYSRMIGCKAGHRVGGSGCTRRKLT